MRPSEARRCAYCDGVFVARASKLARGQVCCSKPCAARFRRPAPASRLLIVSCDLCSALFVARAVNLVRCPSKRRSVECQKLHVELARAVAIRDYNAAKAAQGDGRTPARWRAAVDRRARRLQAVYVEDVDVRVLAERDGWRCHICGRKVPKTAMHPQPTSASVDHLVPVSLGGEHSYRNTALAHFGCNARKHTRAVGEQLRLIG